MARLRIISYELGYRFLPWFNEEGPNSPIDPNESSIITGTESLWKNILAFGDSIISYTQGSIAIQWRGSFKYDEKGRLIDGSVTSIYRRICCSYSEILIDEISYDVKGEYGAFRTLSIPEELSIGLSGTQGVIDYLGKLPQGSIYRWSTPYDTVSVKSPETILPGQSAQETEQSNIVLINGAIQSDDIVGTSINDQIKGLGGDDTLRGAEGDDLIYGGDGNDRIEGNAGEDKLFGDNGNDTIYGFEDNDIIHGGQGSDRIIGGPGNDILRGGKDPDTFEFWYKEKGKDKILDFDGASGDRIIVSRLANVTYTQTGNNLRLTVNKGHSVVLAGVSEMDFLQDFYVQLSMYW